MCPIVPTFTCGLDRSNFSFAISSLSLLKSTNSANSAEHPHRTTSWVIFSRPFGTDSCFHLYPGLRPGLLSAVPSGLIRVFNHYPGLRPRLLSAVPSGLIRVFISTQDCVLGYSQPSLRD